MILSHRHRFIFLKTQKTAGTSIEMALRTVCGDNDIITPISKREEKARMKLGIRGPQNYLEPSARKSWLASVLGEKERLRFYNHISAREIKTLVGDEIWDDYYKFCFERNPYDKLVSAYWNVGGDGRFPNILSYIQSEKFREVAGFDQYSIDGKVAVDDVFKFEEMDSALEKISERIGLEKPLALPAYKAKSHFRKDRRHYSEILTSKERAAIEQCWVREISLLGYSFEKVGS